MIDYYIFFVSLAVILYVYAGYLYTLYIISFFKKGKISEPQCLHEYPTITVLITVYNEADKIKKKIRNILNCNYPKDKLDILIGSDGSTDQTDSIVKQIKEKNVRIFRPKVRKGKTDTQNQAIKKITSDIILFSDSSTIFEKNFLEKISCYFSDSKVGGVTGHLFFFVEGSSGVSTSQGFYWNYELKLRQLESQLGILAVSSGACLAIRKSLFIPMEEQIGEDCIIPLDIVKNGYKMIHVTDAIAYDHMEYDIENEFRTRVRMTLRNIQGTVSRKSLLNPFKYPGYAFALWSHKMLRWLSPFFLIAMTVTSFYGAFQNKAFFQLSSLGFLVFYFAALLGWWGERNGKNIPFIKNVYSFVLANAGFMVGVLKALVGKKIYSYRN